MQDHVPDVSHSDDEDEEVSVIELATATTSKEVAVDDGNRTDGADGEDAEHQRHRRRSRKSKKKKNRKSKTSKHKTKSAKIHRKEEVATLADDAISDTIGAGITPPRRRLRVLVTGCGGYIGGHTCKALIEAGYRVRGTVRNLDDKASYRYLLDDGRIRFPPADDIRLVEAPSTALEFVRADLSDDIAVWEQAMKDCDAVVHIAGPSLHPRDVTDARKQLFVPIVAGTSRVVQAAINSPNIRRFIYTSSVFALSHTFEESRSRGFKAYSDKYWNMDSDMKANAFGFCKTIAERATQTAFETLNDNADDEDDKMSYASVLPACVVGAPLSGRSAASVDLAVVSAMKGEEPMDVELGMVAVQDVANTFVRLLDNPDATGRFILWGESKRLPQVSVEVRKQLGSENQMVAAAIQSKLENLSWRQKLEKFAPPGLARSFERNKGDSAFMKELVQLDGVRFDVSRARDQLGIKFSSVLDANVGAALWATEHGKLTTASTGARRRESKRRVKSKKTIPKPK